MKWKTLESTPLFSSGLLNLRSDRCQLPDGRIMPRYFVLDFPDWVNILPVTAKGELVLIKQYRHGSGLVHLEVPGGSLDPKSNESAIFGARREMLEETGYDSQEIIELGFHYPNPALQSNRMWTYIALNSHKTQDTQWDEFEDMELYLCSLDQLKAHIKNGEVNHSLMLASIMMCLNYLENKVTDL